MFSKKYVECVSVIIQNSEKLCNKMKYQQWCFMVNSAFTEEAMGAN